MQDLARFNDQLQRVVVGRWSCIEIFILPTSRPYRRWIGISEGYQPVASSNLLQRIRDEHKFKGRYE